MTYAQRILLAILILLVDFVIFFLPVLALFAAYVLIARPPWFKTWVDRLYEGTA